MIGYAILFMLIFFYKTGFADFSLTPDISFIPVPDDSVQWDGEVDVTQGASDINVSPSSYDYGSMPIGSSSTKMFLVSNRGSETLVIYSANGTGSDPDQFEVVSSSMLTPPYSLSPGVTIGVRIRFSPTSVGAKSAIVRIESNDPDENPLNVNLFGTGLGPDITLTPPSHNFGHVITGSSTSHIFVVSNVGNTDLSVTSVSLAGTDPGEFSIDSGGGSFTLSAGATRNITVSFRPSSMGSKGALLQIASNDPNNGSLDAALSGTGIMPNIAIAPTSKDYGHVTRGKSSSQTFVLSNTGNAALIVNSTRLVGSNPDQFTIYSGGGSFTLAAGSSRNMIVSFRPTALGEQSAILRFSSNDPDKDPLNVYLNGSGVEQDISVSPDSVDYGDILVGSSFAQNVAIRNAGTATLSVNSVQLTGPHPDQFSIDDGGGNFSLTPNQTHNIVISYRPTTEDSHTAILQIASNDPDENPFDVPLNGTGVSTAMTVSPHEKNFGFVQVDSCSTQTFEISNPGSAALEISKIEIIGEDLAQFSLDSVYTAFSMLPGASKKIKITFCPALAGEKSALLRIHNNVADRNPLDVNLSGQAIEPVVSVSPKRLHFNQVPIDSSARQDLSITNTGSADLSIFAVSLMGPDSLHFLTGPLQSMILAPGDTHSLCIDFSPTVPGEKHAFIRIESNDSDQTPLDVPITAKGVAADIFVNTETIEFGAVLTDTPQDSSFWIGNSGNWDLSIQAMEIIGNDRIDFSSSQPFPLTLPPGDSSQIPIRFHPHSLGVKSAILQLFSNDLDENPLSISLSGASTEGVAPYLAYCYPADSCLAVPANAPLLFKIMDKGAGLDRSSLQVSVAGSAIIKDGLDQTHNHMTMDCQERSISVYYQPEAPYTTDSVEIQIECTDLALSPNPMKSTVIFKTRTATVGSLYSKVFGSPGGELLNPSSGVHIAIPPHTLSDSLNILTATISKNPMLPADMQNIGDMIYIGPDGLQYSDSIAIGLPYTTENLADYGLKDAMNLRVCHYSTKSGQWQQRFPGDADSNHVFINLKNNGYLTLATRKEQIPVSLQISGPEMIYVSQICEYTVTEGQTTYGHPLEYRFMWGDETVSAWSADTVASHRWTKPGIYEVRALGRCAIDTSLTIESDVMQIRVDYKTAISPNEPKAALPTTFNLQQNYPNPFNPLTTFEYHLPVSAHVRLVIYDTLGQHVKTLVDKKLGAGFYELTWTATNQAGHKLSSGVYLCTFIGGDYSKTIKMLLLK
jgi:hypothetical protein